MSKKPAKPAADPNAAPKKRSKLKLALTVVMTSAEDNPSARSGYRDELHGLAARLIEAAAQEAAGG